MPEKSSSGTAGVDAEDKAERAREYRRRYKQRQQDKSKELEQRLEQTRLEIERLRVEQDVLISQSRALSSLSAYSSTMFRALATAASASAATARSVGGKAIEGLSAFNAWAEQQYQMLPTYEELQTGTFWTPSDDLLRFFLKRTTAEFLFHRHPIFAARLEALIEDGKKSLKAKKNSEIRIQYLLSIWLRITTISVEEHPEMMHKVTCIQIKHMRDQNAIGQYVRPRMLQYSPTEAKLAINFSPEQLKKIEEPWKQFVRDIKEARGILQRHTSRVADSVDKAMATGQYDPGCSANAAQTFLMTMDASDASEEFLAKEGRAFFQLWIYFVQGLTPMQLAFLITQCSPLIIHLPDICNLLLDSNAIQFETEGLHGNTTIDSSSGLSTIDGQGVLITDVNESE